MKNTDRKQRFAKSLQAIGLAVAFFLVASPGGSFGQTAVGSKHSAVPAPATAIAPEEVAARSSEVTNLVITFSEKFVVSPEIEKIQQTLPEISKQIDLDAAETAATIGAQPSLAILETQRALWQRWQLQMSTWLTLLTQRAVELRRDLERLAQMKATWTRTRDVAQVGQAPGVVLQQVEATLATIAAAQLPLKTREEAVLGLQADMAAKRARCDEKLAQILKVRNSAVQGIAARESMPVWSPELWGHARTTLPHRLQDIARGFQTSFREYIRDPSRGMPLHVALLLVLTMTTCAARRKKRQWKDSSVGLSPIVKVFDHPYSAALILVLLAARRSIRRLPRVNYGAAPQAVIELLEKTAQAHTAVLKNPPPKGLFTGYGDSSINFELRAWTAQFGNWRLIRSELASAVYDAVYTAGMAFPFPQREVRVLGDETAQKAAGPRPDDSAETTQEEK